MDEGKSFKDSGEAGHELRIEDSGSEKTTGSIAGGGGNEKVEVFFRGLKDG